MIRYLPYAVVASIVGWISFTAFYRVPPVEYKMVRVESANVQSGEIIELEVTAVWRRACEGTSTFVFVDASGAWRITGTMVINPPPTDMLGKPIVYRVTRVVPTMKPGPAYYYGILRMHCSDIWPITVVTPWVPLVINAMNTNAARR